MAMFPKVFGEVYPKIFGGTDAPVPPAPGPLDFHTDNTGLTSFTQQFGLALPQAAVGMSFFYTGTPIFNITYGGQQLQAYAVLSAQGIGSLIAIGQGLTVGTAPLLITCTGGTFGGLFGRINEINYTYAFNWQYSAAPSSPGVAPSYTGTVGEIFAAGVVLAEMPSPPRMTPLPVKTWGYIKDATRIATVSLGRGIQTKVQLLPNGTRYCALQAVNIIGVNNPLYLGTSGNLTLGSDSLTLGG